MALTAPDPGSHPEQSPTPEPPAAGEHVYLELSSPDLQRVHVATELVTHPHSVIHEIRTRLTAGPPETLSVVVTDHRVTIGEKTYALSQLSSVEAVEHAKSVGCALGFLGCGALLFLSTICSVFTLGSLANSLGGYNPVSSNACTFFAALGLIGIGVFLYLSAREHYAVHLTATSGEVDGLRSVDQAPITQIHDAIYRAMVERQG